MKALVYTAPHKIELQTYPDPKPRADEVVVRVRASGVCGSDILGFLGKSKKRVPPLILGHEMAGEVTAVGGDVEDLAAGARVTIMPLSTCGACVHCKRGRNSVCEKRVLLGLHVAGGFAEYAVVPRSGVYELPREMDWLKASMVEPLATPTNLFLNHVRDRIASATIFGAGTQGLLALQLARLRGAGQIFVVDVQDARLAVAERLGARAIHARKVDPAAAILEATGGQGCDVVVDTAGLSGTRQQGLKVVARAGVLAFVGLSDPATELDVVDIINREIEIHGVYGYNPRDFERALSIIIHKDVDVTSWVREFPLDDGPRVFEQLTSNPGDLVKASLTP